MTRPLTVLGLETSCDETAAAVVRVGETVEVLADEIARQDEAHAPFGGVVPEIAARAHAERLAGVIARAMGAAGLRFGDLDAVAATAGPGLIGGVMVGLVAGKAIAIAAQKPLIAVNHLEGHALSPMLEGPLRFPYLLVLVSGGHSQLLWVAGLGDYRRIGGSIDDAAGEAFDKTAKALGLPHPGGPALERLAANGDPGRVPLPRPFVGAAHADMSFAGLKTAAARAAASILARDPGTEGPSPADLAASFQETVADILADRARRALALAPGRPTALVVAGGVAANRTVRAALNRVAAEVGVPLRAPPARWCTDNAAMIALAGALWRRQGRVDSLDAPARPRWPLDAAAAAARPILGAGRKGPKA